MNAVIGALRVVLGADTAQFDEGLKKAQVELRKAARQFERIGGEIQRAGQAVTLGLSAPLAAFGAVTVKTAGDFEAAMNQVSISTKATAKEMVKLEAVARDLGKKTSFSASEAAGAIDALAKNGLNATQILDGAAKASVNLAEATGSEMEPAAAAVTDVMTVFGKSAAELPGVVDRITGSVNESKFSFEDFQGGMAQAGARAAGLGVTFEDFTTSLAATASQFASGSDAGTSFGTFIQRLKPQSEEAEQAMKALGLQFYTAEGAMRPMGEIAEELRTKLGGLSDASLNEALTKIFGADAIRTAIGLMQQGSAGLERVRKEIEETDAAAQAEKRMAGFNGQLKQLGGALEELAISVGKSGLLAAVTGAVKAFADLVDKVSALPKPVLAIGTAVGAFAAALGPAVLMTGAFTASLGVISRAMAGFTVSTGFASTALGGLRAAMAFMMGPWGLVLTGIAIAIGLIWREATKAVVATKEFTKATEASRTAANAYREAAEGVITATGKGREEALRNAAAKKEEASQTLKAAKAKLADAQATLTAARATLAANAAALKDPTNADARTRGGLSMVNSDLRQRQAQAAANLAEMQRGVAETQATIANAEAILKAAQSVNLGNGAGRNFDLSGGGKGRERTAEDIAALRQELDIERQIAIAREQGLDDLVQYLENRLEVARLAEQYEQAGFKNAAQLAEAHVVAIQDARDRQAALNEQAELEARLREQTAFWSDRQLEHDLERARLAGDTQEIRRLERELELRRRIAEYVAQGKTEAEAKSIAGREVADLDKAETQGFFRDSFREGFRSALKGGDFFKEWVADQATRGLEQSLNNLADTLYSLFKNIDWGSLGGGGGGGGAGWLAAAGKVVGSLFTGAPGFATGGSFTVGGRGGIDKNLVAFRATRGEMVDIRKPGQDRGPGGITLVTQVDARDAVLAGTVQQWIAEGNVRAVQAARQLTAGDLARKQRRRMA